MTVTWVRQYAFIKLDVLFIHIHVLTLTVLILYMTNTTYTATVAMKFDMNMHGSQRIISEDLATP